MKFLEIKEKIYIHSPLYVVWKTFTDNKELNHWWPGTEIETKVGGTFKEKGKILISGSIFELNKGKEISFTWKEAGWKKETLVNLKFYPEPAGTICILKHSGWEQFPPEERDLLIIEKRKKWKEVIVNLKKFLEAGTVA